MPTDCSRRASAFAFQNPLRTHVFARLRLRGAARSTCESGGEIDPGSLLGPGVARARGARKAHIAAIGPPHITPIALRLSTQRTTRAQYEVRHTETQAASMSAMIQIVIGFISFEEISHIMAALSCSLFFTVSWYFL